MSLTWHAVSVLPFLQGQWSQVSGHRQVSSPPLSSVTWMLNTESSGEATSSLIEWWQAGRKAHETSLSSVALAAPSSLPRARAKPKQLEPPTLSPELKRPRLFAADPVGTT